MEIFRNRTNTLLAAGIIGALLTGCATEEKSASSPNTGSSPLPTPEECFEEYDSESRYQLNRLQAEIRLNAAQDLAATIDDSELQNIANFIENATFDHPINGEFRIVLVERQAENGCAFLTYLSSLGNFGIYDEELRTLIINTYEIGNDEPSFWQSLLTIHEVSHARNHIEQVVEEADYIGQELAARQLEGRVLSYFGGENYNQALHQFINDIELTADNLSNVFLFAPERIRERGLSDFESIFGDINDQESFNIAATTIAVQAALKVAADTENPERAQRSVIYQISSYGRLK